MDIAVGDTILTRKQHPCGASSFEVLRVGMDFKIRCTGCGREVMLPRAKIEKNIKKVIKPEMCIRDSRSSAALRREALR